MFYNLKIAFRNLSKNRLYSIINITGLAISLAACSFILLWVQDEKSYDRFHKNPDRIYQAITHYKGGESVQDAEIAPGAFAVAAKQNFPEVISYCRLQNSSIKSLKTGNTILNQKDILYVDSSFFSFFNFPIVKSVNPKLLQTPNEIIISESLATELFGNEDPLGKAIHLNETSDVYVSGVMKNMPHQTTLPRADMVCPFNVLEQQGADWRDLLNSWSSAEFYTYLRLKPSVDTDILEKELTSRQTSWRDNRFFTLQPLPNRHLYALDGTPEGIKSVRIFQWIAFVILCIACINYVNLITARSSKRQQEMGFRRIMGARKKQLFGQLIREACILFLIALGIAATLNIILLPVFNALSGKEISPLLWMNKDIWLIYGIMLLSVIIMAGLYPAWTLASFQPAKKIQKKKQSGFFKVLIVLQFVSSVVLIITTIAMQAQLNYIRKKDLGYNREYVFTCNINTRNGNFEVIKTELLKNTAIHEVSCAGEEIVDVTNSHVISDWEGKTSDVTLNHGRMWMDTSFFKTMRMSFVEGAGFTNSSEEQYIINEAAVKAMGMEKPVVGKWMVASGGIRGTIAGVVKDFHFSNFHKKIGTMVIRQNNVGTLYVRTTANDAPKAIAAVEKLWKQYNPEETFTYNFLDDTFNRMYKSDIQTGRLTTIFTLIAILISCLGLFGLVTYTAETKTKEIGIRKVLGARVSNIVNMLSKEFLILVGIALLIAFPLAYYRIDKMLQDYAYHISIGWWIFALAGIITIILTLITVGRQAIKAATANPVKAIKSE